MTYKTSDDFAQYLNFPACMVVNDLDYNERCEYVKHTKECKDAMGVINYMEFLYCYIAPVNDFQYVLGVILLLFICFFVFIVLGTTADKFFCPALKYLSKTMGLNEQLAGVTLLAFGNGSPDVFASLAAFDEPSRFLFSDSVGACLFVITFVSGIIIICSPFKLHASNMLRDVLFLAVSLLFINLVIVNDGKVTFLEAGCILLIYTTYLITAVLDNYLLKRTMRELTERLKRSHTYRTEENISKLESMREEADIEILTRISGASLDIELTRKLSYNAFLLPNDRLYANFLQSLNTFDRDEWQNGSCLTRGLIVIQLPIKFFLAILMPVVDYEADRHGWSKLLNVLQIVTMPLILLSVIFFGKRIFGLPICLYSLVITIPIAIIWFVRTRGDIPPTSHYFLSIYTVCGSVFVIYLCAIETVKILYVLGIITKCSSAFLGCTLLAFGNSIGDLVANVSLSLQGYPKMAFSACIGGPLFNVLISMGGVFSIGAFRSDEGFVKVNTGPLGMNTFLFALITLYAIMFWSISTDFLARRSFGFFLAIMYGIFLLYGVLGEVEFIKTYAGMTDAIDMP